MGEMRKTGRGERDGRGREEEFWRRLHKEVPRHAFRRSITLILCHPSLTRLTLFSLFHHHLPSFALSLATASAHRHRYIHYAADQPKNTMCPVLHQYHRGFPASRPRACTSPSSTGLPVSNLARLRVHRGHVHLSSSLTDCITCAHTRHQHRTTSNTSHTQQRSLFPGLRVAPQQQRTPRPKGACALRDRTPNAPQYARHPRPHRAGSGQARSPRVPGELPGRAKANLEKIPGPLRENRAQQPQIMPRPADHRNLKHCS